MKKEAKCKNHTKNKGYYTFDELYEMFFDGEFTTMQPLDDMEFIPYDYGWELEECDDHYYNYEN